MFQRKRRPQEERPPEPEFYARVYGDEVNGYGVDLYDRRGGYRLGHHGFATVEEAEAQARLSLEKLYTARDTKVNKTITLDNLPPQE